MSTAHLHNEHMTPIASPAAWYSSNVLLAAIRIAQFVSTITALGLLAYLVNLGDDRGFELAVSAISLTYLIVVASATLPLNLYSLTALAVFDVAIFALWVAASGTLGVGYGHYNCSVYASDYDFFSSFYSFFRDMGVECRSGQVSIAFASFSAFLSLCELALLCVNVMVPMNAAFVAAVRPEGTASRLRRFTGLAIARTPAVTGDIEAAAPVAAEPAEPATAEPAEPATAEPAEPATAEPAEPATAEPAEPATTTALVADRS